MVQLVEHARVTKAGSISGRVTPKTWTTVHARCCHWFFNSAAFGHVVHGASKRWQEPQTTRDTRSAKTSVMKLKWTEISKTRPILTKQWAKMVTISRLILESCSRRTMNIHIAVKMSKIVSFSNMPWIRLQNVGTKLYRNPFRRDTGQTP